VLDTNDTGTVFICPLELLIKPHTWKIMVLASWLSILCNSGT